MAANREYVHGIYDSQDQLIAKVWWDPFNESIQCDNRGYLQRVIRRLHSNTGITYRDGVTFLQELPNLLGGGYSYAAPINEDDE